MSTTKIEPTLKDGEIHDKELVLIADLHIDAGTQQRELDQDTVTRYAALFTEGVMLPAIQVVRDQDGALYLWDGFHRIEALKLIECPSFEADITEGDQRYAQWLSFSANRTHGLQRQKGVAERIIKQILQDPEWSTVSLADIARHIGVTRPYVSQVKAKMEAHPVSTYGIDEPVPGNQLPDRTTTTVKRGGQEYEQRPRNQHTPKTHSGQTEYKNTVSDDTSAETHPPDEVLDSVGRPIPSKLRDEFLVLKGTVDGVLSALRSLKADVHSNIEGYTHWETINKSAFDMHHGSLRREIEHLYPYAVCPYCKGIDSPCTACKDRGWVNKGVYDSAPEDLK